MFEKYLRELFWEMREKVEAFFKRTIIGCKTQEKGDWEVDNINNMFSVISIQCSGITQKLSMQIIKIFSEKLKKRTVYIPAGMTFEDKGVYSMTDLYFKYYKKRDFEINKKSNMTIIKPFNCFMEATEIEQSDYFNFINQLSREFDIAVVNLEGMAPERLQMFIEKSAQIAILIDCEQPNFADYLSNFIKNIKLLWGEALAVITENIMFIVNAGKEQEERILKNIIKDEFGEENEILQRIFTIEALQRKWVFK